MRFVLDSITCGLFCRVSKLQVLRAKFLMELVDPYSVYLGSVVKLDAPPSSLMDSTMSPKVKTMEGGVRARSLAHSISGVEGRVGIPGWD